MNRKNIMSVALTLVCLGLPALAQDSYYESEVVQEVPLADGSLLKQIITTEVILPEVEGSYDMPEPEWQGVCVYQFIGYFLYYYDYIPLREDALGNLCHVHGYAPNFVGRILDEADI